MSASLSLAHPLDVVRLAIRYPFRWLLPAAVVSTAVIAFAQVRPDTWEASQQLVVRNEAARNHDGPGKFRHSDELKALLETILELSRSQTVVRAAVERLDQTRPTEQFVSDLIEKIKLAPPKGAEFGKTEVFYLRVKDADRQRATALCGALCDEIELRFRRLRNARAESMVAELTETESLARKDVLAASHALQQVEREVGGDLSELRNLHQSNSGADSDLRRKSLEMESELRQAVIESRRREEIFKLLTEAEADPLRLLTLPVSLGETLPTLRKLRETLLEAQTRTSLLMGSLTREHPQVQNAIDGETEISLHFKRELESALRSAELDWRLAAERVSRLEREIPLMRERLNRLAGLRSEYSRLNAEVENRTRMLNEAQGELVDARAALASAEVASLITRVDQPLTGPKPQGPSRTVLMGSGVLGGLVIGFGVLLLSVSVTAPSRVAHSVATSNQSTAVPFAIPVAATVATRSATPDKRVAATHQVSIWDTLRKTAAL